MDHLRKYNTNLFKWDAVERCFSADATTLRAVFDPMFSCLDDQRHGLWIESEKTGRTIGFRIAQVEWTSAGQPLHWLLVPLAVEIERDPSLTAVVCFVYNT